MSVKELLLIVYSCFLIGCERDETKTLELLQVFVGSTEIDLSGTPSDNLPIDRAITLVFSSPLNKAAAANSILLQSDTQLISTNISFSSQDEIVVIYPVGTLTNGTTYILELSDQLLGANGARFSPREVSFKTALADVQIVSAKMGEIDALEAGRIMNVPRNLTITVNFSLPVNQESLAGAIDITGPEVPGNEFSLSNDNKTVTIETTAPLLGFGKYEFSLSETLKGTQGESFAGFSKVFYAAADETPKFPVIPDNDLLTLVQQQTFKYFYDFAHPASGMARERNTSGDVVTSGGSGFGIMALIVGMERGFITRQQGIERIDKILDFLETADRFHGAWSHWINGSTGKVIPFSAKDDGGDLVETSFLIQGLLTFRQYLNSSDVTENNLIQRINVLWEGVEWDWYRKSNEEVLYWHWSPTYNWEMNFAMYGYFEQQITYFLAAASPTHSIPRSVYTNGYGRNGAIKTGNTYYDINLPLGTPSPLFWVHYSYLGLDPHFTDDYANYWEQNVNASLINRAYCVVNPKKFVGYSAQCWGLTSSDNQSGYNAHSPTNDLGVITPTAALSSFPYTPVESMEALKFFYYTLGDKLWGPYGFYDAFNITEGWYADSYLAIDQGPIIVMIENYRTQLLWNLFMSAPEVQQGMEKLGFVK